MTLLSYLADLDRLFCSPDHQARVAELQRREAAELRAAAERRAASVLSNFPAHAREQAAVFSAPGREADRSPAMRWLLQARNSAAWKRGRSGLMLGPKGTGKTTAACAVARLEALDGRSVRYLKPAAARRLEARAELDAYESADLVIFDQAHQLAECSPWHRVALKDLIDTRYEARRTTLILATMPRAEMVSVLGSENIDRTHPDLRWDADPSERSRRWTR